MKKLLFFASFIIHFASYNTYSQTSNYLWANSAGGTDWDYGQSCTTDASGNIIMTGFFASSSIVFGATTLTNTGSGTSNDFLIVKYDPSGNVVWAKSAGGTGDEWGYSCSVDAIGNIVATGSFRSSFITFGTTTLTSTSTGNDNVFIVKYDPSGNVLWAKGGGGMAGGFGRGCSIDASSNIIVTGHFYSPTISFGTTTLTNADATGNSFDIFIVKYDMGGNALWAKRAGGTAEDVGNSCNVDASGNIIVAGSFVSSSLSFGTNTLTNAGGGLADLFVVKYDPIGNVLWSKSGGGTGSDIGNSCSIDAGGNIIVTGYFASSVLSVATTTLTNAGSGATFDFFIVKYNASGNVIWAKSAGGTYHDYGFSCATDVGGNIIATGYFRSSSVTLGTTILTNANASFADIFIVKYDPSGNVLWVKSGGGTTGDYGYSCATDANGNIIATGAFQSSMLSFGTTNLANIDATGNSSDIFVVKLDGLTGINELGVESWEWEVFPNPSIGFFNLAINLFQNVKIKELKVYTILGECIHSQTDLFSNSQIDLSAAPNGIYFFKLSSDKGIATKKIIINH